MRKTCVPKVSVITICYNAECEIEKTLLSVINQCYTNIEYIIVDGASNDKTVDIIKKYSSSITRWKSEPDRGCYDAMNKGIDMATGDWIVFMNSGDSFYSNNSIAQAISIGEGADVIYGDVKVIASYGSYELAPYPIDFFDKGIMPFCHQSCFVKMKLIRKYRFKIQYKISADFDSLYSIWKETKNFCYIPMTIATYDVSGGSLSFDHYERVLKENYKIMDKGDIKSCIILYVNIAKFYIKKAIFIIFSKLDYKSKYYRRVLDKNKYVKSKSW